MAIPIEDLPVEGDILEKMRSLQVRTVEELVSLVTAMTENQELLMKNLGLNKEQLEALIEKAKERLPSQVAQDLSKRPDPDRMPLGALIDDKPSESNRQKGVEEGENHPIKEKK